MAPSSPADGGDGPFDFDNIDLSENIADYLWGLLVVCGTGLQLVVAGVLERWTGWLHVHCTERI